MKSSAPKPILCSVIILNYFGEKVISNTVNSLLKSSFPKDQLEIIIVDNNSTDKSRSIIDKLVSQHPELIKLYLPKNFGFAGGNNPAIRIAKGKYIILLNNDCLADKNWIKELIKMADSDDEIFSVNSKILLYPKYIDLHIPTVENVFVNSATVIKSNILKYGKKNNLNLTVYRSQTESLIEVPFEEHVDKQVSVRITYQSGVFPKLTQDNLTLQNAKIIQFKKRNTNYICDYQISRSNLTTSCYNKVQNCGNMVFHDGSGRDLGAEVKYMTQNYEKDMGQFDESREVYSSCGAACLYRKSILDKIGLLDENFFMYYEDMELCERARLAGYKVVTCPTAIARHLHALSSSEWSPFFIYQVEKGRLLHIFYHFPRSIFIKEFLFFSLKSTLRILRNMRHIKEMKTAIQYVYVVWFFVSNIGKLLHRKKVFRKIYNYQKVLDNYQKILSGYWLFN